MTISQKPSFLTEILEGDPIPPSVLAYFRTQLRYDFHNVVLREFLCQADKAELTQADLARRIHRKPSQISKLLGAPGNWTFNTVSDLLLGMKTQPSISLISLQERIASYSGKGDDSHDIILPETGDKTSVVDTTADNG